MSEEKKAVTFKVENNQLVISVDPNKDGEAVISVVVNIAEIPDEVASALIKKN